MKTIIIGTLMEFYASGQPVILEEKDLPQDTKILETDSEVPNFLSFERFHLLLLNAFFFLPQDTLFK
jgi:hypothetical protein